MFQTRIGTHLEDDGPETQKKFPNEYLAFVRDSNDPEIRGRVKVYCPETMGDVDSEEEWVWAEAKHFMTGFDQGFMCVPPDPSWSRRDTGGASSPYNETRVFVTFRNGDPARPLYSPNGSWYGENELPSHVPKLITMNSGGDETTGLPNYVTTTIRKSVVRPENATTENPAGTLIDGPTAEEPKPQTTAQYPFNHIYKSPAGHVIELDNTRGAERFRLYHPAGTSIEINQAGSWATKIQGKETKWVVEDSTRIVKQSDTTVVEGASHYQVNGTSTEIYGDSRMEVVERAYDCFYKKGWTIEAGGQVKLATANFDLESTGTITMLAGGGFAATGDNVTLGGNTVEVSGTSTKIKSTTGVSLQTALLPATHPIYASLLINPIWTSANKAINAASVALGKAVTLAATTPLVPSPMELALVAWTEVLAAQISALSAIFNTSLTLHKASLP